jgi:hypothetical protein
LLANDSNIDFGLTKICGRNSEFRPAKFSIYNYHINYKGTYLAPQKSKLKFGQESKL